MMLGTLPEHRGAALRAALGPTWDSRAMSNPGAAVHAHAKAAFAQAF